VRDIGHKDTGLDTERRRDKRGRQRKGQTVGGKAGDKGGRQRGDKVERTYRTIEGTEGCWGSRGP
jgi:hypothetical protein